jgi:hypothetical protein
MRGLLRVRSLVMLAVVLVVAYGALSWVFADKMIAPQARPLGTVDPALYGLPKPTIVEVPGNGVRLASWYFPNPRNEHCAVIMLHGFGGARAEVVGASPIFWDRGCDLLLYDSRGHGDSSPALLTFGPHEKEDLVAAIAWLSRRTQLPDRRIGLIGWSYGAAVSIQAAAKVPGIAFVIADSSYSSLTDIANVQAGHQFGAWAKAFVPGALLIAGRRAGFDPGNASPVAAIRHVKAPVLLIHSRQDGFTPYQHSEKIYAASNKARTRLVIPAWSAPHAESFRTNPAGYTKIVDRFIAEFKLPVGPRRAG